MSNQLSMGLMTLCVFALLLTGCHHHVSRQDRVWNGWCGSHACGTDCDEDCGKGAKCGKAGSYFHLGGIGKKFRNYFVCANGCGERYVGEWISDPPDCCEPCDEFYGCFTGTDGCCCKQTFDPIFGFLKWKHRHCRPWHVNESIPSSGCHYVECPFVYGCHPTVYPYCGSKGGSCKSCGKGCGGGVVGDYVPDTVPAPQQEATEDFPIPTPTLAEAEQTRVAAYNEAEEE